MPRSPSSSEPARPAEPRVRDADRTREAVLDAAEHRFASLGYDGASLADIGQDAGVSRGTPSYFFGSKEQLYIAVLERLYRERDAALGVAFDPLVVWAEAEQPRRSLKSVLGDCVDGYLGFLLGRPTYIQIMEREALAGATLLSRIGVESSVMETAFGALRRRARAHDLRNFDVAEVIMLLTALGFFPVAHRATLLRRQGLDLGDPKFVARRKQHIVDMLLHAVGAPGA